MTPSYFSFKTSYWFQQGQPPWTENPSLIKTDCKPLVPPTPFRQLSIQNKINLGLFSSSSCFAKIITMQLLQLPSFNKYILLLYCATAQPHPWPSSQKSWQLWDARLRTLNQVKHSIFQFEYNKGAEIVTLSSSSAWPKRSLGPSNSTYTFSF